MKLGRCSMMESLVEEFDVFRLPLLKIVNDGQSSMRPPLNFAVASAMRMTSMMIGSMQPML